MAIEHIIQPGESLSIIAKKYGFGGNWKKIYDYNPDFKKDFPNPNTIRPYVVLKIPDKTAKKAEAASGQVTTFRKKVPPPVKMKIKPEDHLGNLYRGKEYRIEIDGLNVPFEGTVPDNGIIEHEIPADCKKGKLYLWLYDDYPELVSTWNLKINQLIDVNEISGIQQRLKNLSLYTGAIDGVNGPVTKASLLYFQSIHKLEPTGTLNDKTMEALRNPPPPEFPKGKTAPAQQQIAEEAKKLEGEPPRHFEFVLLDSRGKPVEGAQFRISHSAGRQHTDYTDSSGIGTVYGVTSDNGILEIAGLKQIGLKGRDEFSPTLEIPTFSDSVIEVVFLLEYEFE